MKRMILIAALVVFTNLVQAWENDGENEGNKKRIEVDAVVRYANFHPPHFHNGIAAFVCQPFILCLACLLATGMFVLMAKKQ